MVIATSTDRPLVEAALEYTGLAPFFSAVFTCTEVGAGKAKPDVYEAARAFLGTPKAQTWVFEDALLDVYKRQGWTSWAGPAPPVLPHRETQWPY